MDIRQLQAFITLAGTGSYRSAAEQLCLTQPALTKRIQALELLWGVTLFTRGRHGATLTAAGQQLLEKAQKLVKEGAELQQLAAEVASGKAGQLAIGFGISGIADAPRRVAAFRQHYPQVSVSLEDMSSAEQAIALLNGSLQLGFMRLPVEPPLSGMSLRCETLALAVARPQRESVATALADGPDYQVLERLPLLALHQERAPGLNQQIARFLALHQRQPQVQQYARDIQTLLALVAGDNGVAILPLSALTVASAEVVMLPLHGPFTRWDTGLVWNPLRPDALRDRFIALLSQPAV
ncbi:MULTISPECIES: LysR family transcriptional regulator [unclassified Erwinia]|uniref:LysR family transcriptional regulator n=1 Tax=unclassified Erwinia TaxID=2622719 RepID=UPI0006FC0A70|nr:MULTISPECIES: LysR family transcriptional regulator [unclassified Erwinia]KQN53533.1 hypothetical protein ASF13_15360 [Erwinia sp. Leaf53]PLV55126.1 hypothetical protein NV64_17360 [Erwinia sp. B116]